MSLFSRLFQTRRPPMSPQQEQEQATQVADSDRAAVRYDDAQQRVIACDDHVVVAEAFAGAGKTTTAIGFTEARPNTRFLYVCFNRANADEARQRFGAHVDCKTSHALAWAAVGRRYGKQIAQGGWRARQLQAEIGCKDVRTAALAQSILTAFFASADKNIDAHHTLDAKNQYGATEAELSHAMDAARIAWNSMKTPGNPITVPHDAYLKVWALGNPRLPYDHIILDEAQDTNPVMVDVIRRQQKNTKLLLIGDRHQSIYGFRKAYNAMELFAAMGGTVLKIPRTWRFNQKIADVANALLSHFKGEDTAIIGAGPSKERARRPARTVLSRTNAGLFKEAAEVGGKGVYWVGGIEGYRVNLLLDAWHLRCGNRAAIMTPAMAQYQSWQQFSDEAEVTRDPEARMLVRFIETYGRDTPSLVRAFQENALPNEQGAKLILSTAHKAKGLDFDHVAIGEDFECINKAHAELVENYPNELSESMRQEINLLYVAVTRARHKLDLNKETKDFLLHIDKYRAALQEAAASNAARIAESPAPQ